MNWEAIGTVAEVVAAIAVVISLIYLAKQIRAQIRESRLTAAHDITAGFRDVLVPLMDSDVAELLVRANDDFEALTASEKIQIIVLQQRSIRLWEEAYYQYKGGRLDKPIWDTIVKTYAAYLSAPSFAKVWEIRREFYNSDFVDFVDSIETRQIRWK